MSKHTPGPWFVQDDHGKRYIDTSGNDDTIAEIHRRRSKGSVYSCPEAGCNASLIAAAPDLLEALEYALSMWGDYLPAGNSNAMKAIKQARAAIARAKGESQ